IFRTELQHKPEASRASDGTELFFAWSIYLPEPLPAGGDQDYQLAYFEREYNGDYRQVFGLHVVEQNLFLNFNQPQTGGDVDAGVLEVGQWHRIVFHVNWSSDANEGFVSLWLDGVKQVDEAHARTFIDAPAFMQLGLLKNP